jgi:hypothetical protein
MVERIPLFFQRREKRPDQTTFPASFSFCGLSSSPKNTITLATPKLAFSSPVKPAKTRLLYPVAFSLKPTFVLVSVAYSSAPRPMSRIFGRTLSKRLDLFKQTFT